MLAVLSHQKLALTKTFSQVLEIDSTWYCYGVVSNNKSIHAHQFVFEARVECATSCMLSAVNQQ